MFPWRPVSETTRLALVAGSEHLQLACQVVDGPRGYATASHTVIRGALLGGSTAVWILGPDDPQERQQRGLRLAHEWYRRKKRADEISRAHCPPQDLPRLDEQIKHSEKQAEKVKAMWTARPLFSAKEKPTDTKIIEWVADFLFSKRPAKEASVLGYWSELSGDAHALGWQFLGRRTSPMARDRGPLHRTEAEAGIEHLADPYLAAHAVVERGWALFDRRCTGS